MRTRRPKRTPERWRTRGAKAPCAPRYVIERLLRDHSIPVSAMLSLGLLVMALADAGRGLRSSQDQRRRLSAMCCELAAEEAAFAEVRIEGGLPAGQTSWGLRTLVEKVRDGDDRLAITVESGSERARFWCELLRGAAHRSFGRPLTLGDGLADANVAAWLHGVSGSVTGSLPQLALPQPSRYTPPELFCDSEVAFLHVSAGTDRTDFTVGAACDQVAPPSEAQVVEVAGNLWLLPAARPLTFVLRAPLTLVVRGNVYVGRSLAVVGPGRLTVVAHRTGGTFRDLDGNGARAASEPLLGAGTCAVEGDGAIYLGMPNSPQRADLTIAAHLVAEGEVHLLTRTRTDGALVGAHSLTRCSPTADLTLTGRLLVDVGRTRIPGFATSGGPRPGLLHRVVVAE